MVLIVKTTLLLLLLAFSMATDIRCLKVKNIVTFPFMLAGMTANLILLGMGGFFSSAAGIVLSVMTLFLIYFLGFIGAGDVKLFAAIGSIMGFPFSLGAMVLSFLSGGVLCSLILIRKGIFIKKMKNLFLYLFFVLYHQRIAQYEEIIGMEETMRFPLTLAIVPASAANLLLTCCGKGIF